MSKTTPAAEGEKGRGQKSLFCKNTGSVLGVDLEFQNLSRQRGKSIRSFGLRTGRGGGQKNSVGVFVNEGVSSEPRFQGKLP